MLQLPSSLTMGWGWWDLDESIWLQPSLKVLSSCSNSGSQESGLVALPHHTSCCRHQPSALDSRVGRHPDRRITVSPTTRHPIYILATLSKFASVHMNQVEKVTKFVKASRKACWWNWKICAPQNIPPHIQLLMNSRPYWSWDRLFTLNFSSLFLISKLMTLLVIFAMALATQINNSHIAWFTVIVVVVPIQTDVLKCVVEPLVHSVPCIGITDDLFLNKKNTSRFSPLLMGFSAISRMHCQKQKREGIIFYFWKMSWCHAFISFTTMHTIFCFNPVLN